MVQTVQLHRIAERLMTILALLMLHLASSSDKVRLSQHELFTADPEQFSPAAQLFERLDPPDLKDLHLPVVDSSFSAPGKKKKDTYAIIVSYNGLFFPGGYHPNPSITVPTVRGTLGREVERLLESDVSLSTAGRTDAGVSAKAVLFSFKTYQDIDSIEAFLGKLNDACTPQGMTIHSVELVDKSFHATFSTKSREYIYVLPVHRSFQSGAQVARAVQNQLDQVVGEELDFFGMSKGKIETIDSLCTLQTATCCWFDGSMAASENLPFTFAEVWPTVTTPEFPGCLVFRFKANRFLKRMVRKMINSVLQEATLPKGCWRDRIMAKERGDNHPAPGEGLCFWRAYV
uniref:tRNA pseudouridine synthase n=1 Tax=Grammatophora oceanica TaxID=210454 RepID=A0A7S1YE86_9STRA